jgi:integrase
MAQLTERGSRVWRVQFRTHKPYSITVRGKRGEAEILRGYLSRLEQFYRAGIPPTVDVIEWARGVSPDLKQTLSESGLVNLGPAGVTLDDLIKHAERVCENTAPRTKINHRQYHKSLREHFGDKRPLSSITPGDCDSFRSWLGKKNYGPASIAKRIKHSRQVFNYALRQEWISRNPFNGIRVPVPIDTARRFYITPEMTHAVLDCIRAPEDKLVFALARWAGFRVGSEVRELHWHDIDLDLMTMRVWSPKTKTYRVCPVFVELQPYLTEPGEGLVCPNFCRGSDQFYRKKLLKAIKRAKLQPWPDLLLNCRRSRATEVVEQFGVKAESDWIGHGPDISKRHYQMTLEEKIDAATGRKLKTK